METELALWARLARDGAGVAMLSLSQMIGRGIEASSAFVPADAMARHMGGPDVDAVGVHLTVSGGGSGHIMVMCEVQMANGFADLLMGQAQGTTSVLGEMERSALGELTNVVGGNFLSTVADATGQLLAPSPPSLMMQTPDVLLGAIARDLLQAQGTAYVAETTFSVPHERLWGILIVVPGLDLLSLLPQARLAG